MKYSIAIFLAIVIAAVAYNSAFASQMVYRGINSNISPGAPYNPNIASTADRNRPYNPRSVRLGESDAEIARRTVISTATSQLTSSSGAASGHIDFGDGSYADYTTNAGIRTVTITNPDGTSTTISFPI